MKRTESLQVISLRVLNRTLLERQMLLNRVQAPAFEVIHKLAGIQSQAPLSAYYGLWARITNFDQAELASLIQERSVVRLALMRSTIHLVTAADALGFRTLLVPLHERGFNGVYRRGMDGIDVGSLAAFGRKLVEEQPLTFSELGDKLQTIWPGYGKEMLAYAIRTYVPLVQVPPRGIWGESGQATHTSLESWTGQPLPVDYSVEQMIIRYLAAFGPASIKDMQAWSGLTRLNIAFDKLFLEKQLRIYQDEQGVIMYDLVGLSLCKEETIAPVRLISEFDNMLLSYADRSRILAEKYRKKLFSVNGIIRAALLVDGFVCGTWRIERLKNTAALIIEHYEPISQAGILAIIAEGTSLLKFAAPDAAATDIQFVPNY